MLKQFQALLLLFCITVIALNSCSPLSVATTAPALALGAYDNSEKRKNWLRYAENGDVYAQYELAKSYCCNDTEGELDKKESAKWYCTAARNGFAKAQIEVGKLYEGISELTEMNFPKDKVRAYMWYSLAARRAVSEGMDLKKKLRPQLNEKEMRQSGKLIQNYTKVDCEPE